MLFECPYCDKEIDEDEAVDCNETCKDYEHECPHCGEEFVFEVDYDKLFYTKKRDAKEN